MTSLNNLKNLVNKLRKEEIKSLINFLDYQKDAKDLQLKSIRLVKLLRSDQNHSSNDVQITLYGKVNYNAFSKLINRLKSKIYEIILFDNNLEKTILTRRNRIVFDIRKKLIQSEILFSRGINNELESFQNKIIQKAKEYEVYDSMLEALHAKQRYLGFISGSNGYLKLKEEIEFYENSRVALIRAREIFNNITSKINFSASSEEYGLELNKAIKILKNDFEKTKSATIGYYYYFLETEMNQNQNNLTLFHIF